jgi:hypothetical protein
MTRYSEYYLSITPEGKWRGLGYTYPPRELDDGDVMLTYDEFKFLKEIKSLEQGYKILDYVKEKIEERKKKIKERLEDVNNSG